MQRMFPTKIATPQSANRESPSTPDGWLVARVHPRKEEFALRNLAQQSFRTFCPRFSRMIKRGRSTITALAPLFPGYIFVKEQAGSAPLRSVKGTFGIQQVLGGSWSTGGAVPEKVMAALFARCPQGIASRIKPEFCRGETIRVLVGPLANKIAVIEDFDDAGRVSILFDLLGRELSIKVQDNMLGPT
jgi:transcription antitermination factor NusG